MNTMHHELRATRALRLIGGYCRNRYQFAQHHYRSADGYKCGAYEAVDRAIKYEQIVKRDDGSIVVKQQSMTQ